MAPWFYYLRSFVATLLFGNLLFSCTTASRSISDVHEPTALVQSKSHDMLTSQLPQLDNMVVVPTPTPSNSPSVFDFPSTFKHPFTSQIPSLNHMMGSPTPITFDSPSFITEQPMSHFPSLDNQPTIPTQPISQSPSLDNKQVLPTQPPQLDNVATQPISQSPPLDSLPVMPTPPISTKSPLLGKMRDLPIPTTTSRSPSLVEDQHMFEFPSVDSMAAPSPPTTTTAPALPSFQESTPGSVPDPPSSFPFFNMPHVPKFQPIASFPFFPIVPTPPSNPDISGLDIIVSVH